MTYRLALETVIIGAIILDTTRYIHGTSFLEDLQLQPWDKRKPNGAASSRMARAFPFRGEQEKRGLLLKLTTKKISSSTTLLYGALRQCSEGLSCQQHHPYP
jgi:hypothetical protein